jgi:predicted ester cyclase
MDANTATLERYVAATNAGESIEWYFGLGYVYHGPMGDLDQAGFMAQHDGFAAAFPDARMRLLDVLADGDRTVARWRAEGTHRGALMGIPPTGRTVVVTGIIVSRFADGKAVEEWEEINLLGLMQQLGAGPGGT